MGVVGAALVTGMADVAHEGAGAWTGGRRRIRRVTRTGRPLPFRRRPTDGGCPRGRGRGDRA
nr:hypothetical protein [Streptomyces sp. SID8354]